MTQEHEIADLRARLKQLYEERLRDPEKTREFMIRGGFVTPKGKLTKRYAPSPAPRTEKALA